MKYGQIRKIDVANGRGIRTSIFVTGCYFNCFNCFNKEYQDFEYGNKWTTKTTDTVIQYLREDFNKGLSILGGEPMEHPEELTHIIQSIKPHMRDNQDIWLWSGYKIEDILLDDNKKALLQEVDVLIDGQFKEELKDLTLKWRGSSNQRVIDVNKTFSNNSLTFYE